MYTLIIKSEMKEMVLTADVQLKVVPKTILLYHHVGHNAIYWNLFTSNF